MASVLKDFVISLGMEPDEHRLADSNRRSSQVACRPKHELRQCVVVRAAFLQVDLRDVLTLRDQHFCHAFKQRESFCGPETLFLRINLFGSIDIMRRKELLRASTGCSALAVVTPVSFDGHEISFLEVVPDLL